MSLIDIKFRARSHSEFTQAWGSLIKLGYTNENKPETCPYLYGYADGRITYDFFDSDDADLNAPGSAFQCFINHPNKEVTLDELVHLSNGGSAENDKSIWGVDIHIDDNGVTVTHNEWIETDNGDQQLDHGHFYDIIAGSEIIPIRFQHGPVKEQGVNGITNESLLAVLIHRTKILNNNFSCAENKQAITYMENALALFNKRTAERKRRGVEGLNKE